MLLSRGSRFLIGRYPNLRMWTTIQGTVTDSICGEHLNNLRILSAVGMINDTYLL